MFSVLKKFKSHRSRGVKKKRIVSQVMPLSITFLLLALNCLGNEPAVIAGRIMGTTYHISVVLKGSTYPSELPGTITEKLEEITKIMSLFDASSELSRFNSARKDQPVHVSFPFMKVFMKGKELYHLTGGAWDGTVAPLVNLWGFGPLKTGGKLPDSQAITRALERVGYSLIRVSGEHSLVKTKEGVGIDFGSIAKGYAADEISELLKTKGFKDYIVEIGGEIKTGGTNHGKPWKIGINTPVPGSASDQVVISVELEGKAIATSGDYRNFKIDHGMRYSHEIDPRTGRPVNNDVASVSVISDSAAFADGLATALMVIGEEKGIELVDSINGVSCLFIVRDKKGNGELHVLKSKNFPAYHWEDRLKD
jgi:thiamine biosynthesis lipoprotein